MSSLNKKVSHHLDEQYPPEFDEKWVNKLLTDNEAVSSKKAPNLKELNRKQATLKEMALLEAEIRKQRIIRKAKAAPKTKTTEQTQVPRKSPNTLSAIQKQKKAYQNKRMADSNAQSKTDIKNPIKRVWSRLKSR